MVDQLQRFGETRRGWLGVRIQDVSEDVADAIGLEAAAGALVTDVPEGPAMEAGIEAGDVIVTFDGYSVEDTRGLVRRVGNTTVGKAVDVVVFRDGQMETLSVTLGRRETAEAIPAVQPGEPVEPATAELLGLTISVITDEMRAEMDLPDSMEGLLVTDVPAESEAFEKGLRAGDIITEAGQQSVTRIAELEERIEAAEDAGRRSILLLVRRAGEPRFVALSLE